MNHLASLTATAALLAFSGPMNADQRLLQPPPSPVPLERFDLRPSLCAPLQGAVKAAVGAEPNVWSISVVDQRGRLLADHNGNVPRVPASNQKLIATAFALDRLGPDFRLKTQLLRHGDGSLEMVGEGDPDLTVSEIQRFAMVALGQGGSRTPSTLNPGGQIKLLVREEPRRNWWPSDWDPIDRSYAYGAPITRLALTSNALHMAVMDPAARLQTVLDSAARRQGGSLQTVVVPPAAASVAEDSRPADQTVVLHSESSAPMHALLSLANTESHNFTAEVLLREAADDWDVQRASYAATRWMQSQGIPMAGLRIRDGSGLSRGNRLTSRTLSALLLRMAQHPLAPYYQASMAIAGERGTLRRLYRGTSLQGRFRGKTGTLSGVRTISGTLDTSDGPLFVSMLSNGSYAPNGTMGDVLRAAQRFSRCSSLSGVEMQPGVPG